MNMNLSITEQTGNRIRQLRTQKGLSQESLAFSAGISTVYLGQLERGLKSPTVETINKLCHALELSISEFFLFDSAENNEKYNLAYATIAASLKELPPDSALKLSLIIKELSDIHRD